MGKNNFKPGQKAQVSGQYEMVGPRGGHTGLDRTIVKNEPFPPTQQPGQSYVLVDRTKTGGK